MKPGADDTTGPSIPAAAGVRGLHAAAVIVICTLLALAAIAMCDYAFGLGDQRQYLVHVVAIEHPGTLEGDAYFRAFEALRSVLWRFIAAVSNDVTVAPVCLAVALGAAAVSALLLMRLGTVLLPGGIRRRFDLVVGTAAALVLVVPKEQHWFGVVSLSDVELTATSAVIPLVIGSMLAWTTGHRFISLLVAAAAVPLHAQSAAYVLSAWVVVALWSARRSPRQLILPVIVGVGGVLAVLRERAVNGVAPALLDEFERIGRTMFVESLDPTTARWTTWAAVFAILALGAASAGAIMRSKRDVTKPQRAVFTWTIASLLFPMVGMTLVAAGMREPLLWRLMVGRALMLPQIASLVFFAVWAIGAMRRGGPSGWLAAVALLLVAWWPFPNWPYPVAAVSIAAVVACPALELLRTKRRPPAHPRLAVGGVLIASLLVAAVAGERFWNRPYPWLSEVIDESWRTPQLSARDHTEPWERFLTPPHRTGWRIGSHRSTFGELNDGALLFQAGEELIAWADRMEQLGFEPTIFERAEKAGPRYAQALAGIDPAWCAVRGIDYVVTEAPRDVEIGTVVWSSPDFVIRRVR